MLLPLVVIAAIAMAVPAEPSGRIYVYAQRPTAARSWLPVACDGAVAAELKQGMIFAIDVTPGRHVLSTETGVPASVDVHAGEETFVRLDWNYQEGRLPVPVLAAVRPDLAQKEIRYLSYVGAKRIHSASVLRTDPREPAPLRLKKRGE